MSFPSSNMLSNRINFAYFDFWTVTSTSSYSFSMTVKGTADKSLRIDFGDSNTIRHIFNGSFQTITHLYNSGTYQQKWSVDKSEITVIRASNQKLTGSLPIALKEFTSLVDFRIANNDFTTDLSDWSTAFGNWLDIEILHLDNNNFTGYCNAFCYSNWTSLQELYLYSNELVFLNDNINIFFTNRASKTESPDIRISNNNELLTGTEQSPDLGTYSGSIHDLTEAQINYLVAGKDYDNAGSNVFWSTLEKVWVLENLDTTSTSGTKRYNFSIQYTAYTSNIIALNSGVVGKPVVPDWVDSDADGLGDNWNTGTGNPTLSIVTGNGFIGKAQRQYKTGSSNSYIYSDNITITTGESYVVSFKHRSQTGLQVSIQNTTTALKVANVPANTSDATVLQLDEVEINKTFVHIRIALVGSAPGNIWWCEIDEVQLIKI